jgi:hypothetical protein
MRKMNVVIMSVILLLPALVSAASFAPKFSVETSFTDPYPLEPGAEAEITLTITNTGSDTVDDITIELNPTEPFTLLENGVKSLNSMYIGSERQVTYKIFVGSSAVSSTYEVPVLIKFENAQLEKNIELTVQGIPKFNLADVRTGTVKPGDEELITVELENIGTGKAKRTRVIFNPYEGAIEPILSSGNVYLGDIDPGEKTEVQFEVLISQDTEFGVYTTPINVTYEDEAGNELNKEFDIGILVGGDPELQVVKSEIDAKNGELEIEIINVGSAEAIGIKGELYIKDELFDIDYLTQLKIDKKITLKFKVPKTTSGELKLLYKGPDNTRHEQEEHVTWERVGGGSFGLIVVVLIVLLIVFRKKIMAVVKKKLKKKR